MQAALRARSGKTGRAGAQAAGLPDACINSVHEKGSAVTMREILDSATRCAIGVCTGDVDPVLVQSAAGFK
jgi:hypothetical protein